MRELVDLQPEENHFDSGRLQPSPEFGTANLEPVPGAGARAMDLEKQREFHSCHMREL